jgi:hypothetical protein
MIKYIIFLAVCIISCFDVDQQTHITQNEHSNDSSSLIEHTYSSDCLLIRKQLLNQLSNKISFFKGPRYSDSTKIIVDTILYGPNFNRMAAFVIAKNSTARQLVPNKDYAFFFDATCYLGFREADTIGLYWIGPSFTSSYSQAEISKDIREECLYNFASNDFSTPLSYEYNMSDGRFWTSKLWEQVLHKRGLKK